MNATTEGADFQPRGPRARKSRAGAGALGAQPIRERLRFVRDLRHLIAENAAALAATAQAVSARPLPEKLVSEVLPLADGAAGLRAKRRVCSRRGAVALGIGLFSCKAPRSKCSASRSGSCS